MEGYEGATMTLGMNMGFASPGDDFSEPSGKQKAIDEELLLASIRAGGARGIITTNYVSMEKRGWPLFRNEFAAAMTGIFDRLHGEKNARSLQAERKALTFETVASIEKENRRITIKLRDFSLARVVDARDAGEMVADIERPSTKFDDVIGAAGAKEALQFVIHWLRNPRYYAGLGIRPPRGILLTGPPGTGKTMLARAVAGESRCAFLEASASSFITMWQGSGPQNVRDLFERARRYAPAIVFIDEIDAIGKTRTGSVNTKAEESTLNALLTEIDGFGAPAAKPVIVLAATNLSEHIDPALKRRFDRIIEVDKPDRAARLLYLQTSLGSRSSSSVSTAVMERIAGQSAGMSIADLERVIHEAGVMASRHGIPIDDALLEEAFEKQRMGEAKKTPDRDTLLRVARHEAGHALIAWQGGNPPVQLTIVGRGHAGGYMERESSEERLLYTKPELEQMIRESMGGRAAEIIYYGEDDGLSSGVSSDLEHASHWARLMVGEFAMAREIGNIAFRKETLRDGPLAVTVSQVAERIVTEELHKAKKLLNDHRHQLDRLVDGLMEKNRLAREEIASILGAVEENEGSYDTSTHGA